MSSLPYFQVLIDHSRNPKARADAAAMKKTIGELDDVRTSVLLDERDWWSDESVIVNAAVSYTPFGDDDGSKRARAEEFADRLTALLGTTVRIHDNLD